MAVRLSIDGRWDCSKCDDIRKKIRGCEEEATVPFRFLETGETFNRCPVKSIPAYISLIVSSAFLSVANVSLGYNLLEAPFWYYELFQTAVAEIKKCEGEEVEKARQEVNTKGRIKIR